MTSDSGMPVGFTPNPDIPREDDPAQRVMQRTEDQRIKRLVDRAQDLRDLLAEADGIANELRKEGYNVRFSQMEHPLTGSKQPHSTSRSQILAIKNSGALIVSINRDDVL